MAARVPSMLTQAFRRSFPGIKQLEPAAASGAAGMVSVRYRSDTFGSGEGKGGGGGGAYGRKSQVMEEEYFRLEQARELKELKNQLTKMRLGKIEYHRKQVERHIGQIKKHEELMAEDGDPKHMVHINSHKESVAAHEQYLKKLERAWKP